MDEVERIKKKKMEEMLKKARGQDFPQGVIKVTDSDFGEVIKKYPLVLVDFWADWCHPCKIVAPVIEDLANEYRGKLVCAKLNVDENKKTATLFNIMSIPTLLLFKNGQVVEKIVGALPKPQLLEKLRPHF
jgi:thioredoxin 1